MSNKIFKNGTIIGHEDAKYMLVRDGKVEGFSNEEHESYEVVDANGGYILPGFVDQHVHGGGGADFMDGTPDAYRTVAETHASHGTTSIVPTTVACPPDVLFAAFDNYRSGIKATDKVDFLGIHLEGPFLAPEMKGAQSEDRIYPPTPELVDKLLDTAGDIIVRCSGAPEVPYMYELAEKMSKYNIMMSIGHSNAVASQVIEAYDHGYRHITHMYCSTPSVRKINQVMYAGIIEACYLLDGMCCELIGDGCHVARECIRLVHKLKGTDKAMFITDAMRAAGTDVTESYLGDIRPENRVIIENGVAKLPDRSFYAGSIATMDRVFRTAVQGAGLPMADVSKMMSLTPARLIGCDDRKGSLDVGKDADIVIFDHELKVDSVFLRGRRTF